MEYQIIEHAVEGTGERHFLRVAVWFKKVKGEPDAYADFLVHPGSTEPVIVDNQMVLPDPMDQIIAVIEQRLPSLTKGEDDSFTDDERAAFGFHAGDRHIDRKVASHLGTTRKARV